MTLTSQWIKLRDKAYREEFVAAQARRAIPYQVRALMKAKKISQQELAERSGLTQGVISRAANPAYGKLTLNTIIRIAAGFDVAFIGRFVPFSKLEDYFDALSESELADVPTFDEEDASLSVTATDLRVPAGAGALREAAIAPQKQGSPWFRLTPPRQNRGEHGTLVSFPRRSETRRSAADEAMAVSQ